MVLLAAYLCYIIHAVVVYSATVKVLAGLSPVRFFKEMMPAIEKCAALVTVEGGLTSHAAVVGVNLGIPVIVGADNATTILKEGQNVSVDAQRGIITDGKTNIL